ncbi:arsenate reductase [Aquimarina intermedia]|uniref:Arsenate reductase n=2 Tax=Aquimarina intermedia TaxID=350814 RepID=A0A5S5C7D3_9FLAO|nr:arsenate reductase [Aquimarina intermedia]
MSMATIAKNERQLTLYYSSESSTGKQTAGYVQSSDQPISLVDITKQNPTPTHWTDLAEMVGKTVDQLIDKEHPDISKEIQHADLEPNDWLKIIAKTPQVIKDPIAVMGERAKQIVTATEVLKFFDVDSAGIEKKPVGEEPTTTRTTKDENFIDE